MRGRRHVAPLVPELLAFAGYRFPPAVIMVAVRWYLQYGLSYRDVEELLVERGVEVDHVSIYSSPKHQSGRVGFGEIIRLRRAELGISQTELGHRAGVSQQTVARWENRGAPSFVSLEKLATALAMEQRDLMVAAGETVDQSAPNSREPLHALIGALPTMAERELLTVLELTTKELKKRFDGPQPESTMEGGTGHPMSACTAVSPELPMDWPALDVRGFDLGSPCHARNRPEEKCFESRRLRGSADRWRGW